MMQADCDANKLLQQKPKLQTQQTPIETPVKANDPEVSGCVGFWRIVGHREELHSPFLGLSEPDQRELLSYFPETIEFILDIRKNSLDNVLASDLWNTTRHWSMLLNKDHPIGAAVSGCFDVRKVGKSLVLEPPNKGQSLLGIVGNQMIYSKEETYEIQARNFLFAHGVEGKLTTYLLTANRQERVSYELVSQP